MNRKESLLTVRKWNRQFADPICRWVPDQATLDLISGDKDMCLRPALLAKWTDRAIAGYVLLAGSKLVGFATIGTNEWELPEGMCEIGHLVIHPEYRRNSFSILLLSTLSAKIRKLGFRAAVARAVPDNLPAVKMLRKAKFIEVNEDWCEGTFRWFIKSFSE